MYICGDRSIVFWRRRSISRSLLFGTRGNHVEQPSGSYGPVANVLRLCPSQGALYGYVDALCSLVGLSTALQIRLQVVVTAARLPKVQRSIRKTLEGYLSDGTQSWVFHDERRNPPGIAPAVSVSCSLDHSAGGAWFEDVAIEFLALACSRLHLSSERATALSDYQEVLLAADDGDRYRRLRAAALEFCAAALAARQTECGQLAAKARIEPCVLHWPASSSKNTTVAAETGPKAAGPGGADSMATLARARPRDRLDFASGDRYTEHVSAESARKAVSAGRLVQGVLQIATFDPAVGAVEVQEAALPAAARAQLRETVASPAVGTGRTSRKVSIRVHGRSMQNRALHGDTVCVLVSQQEQQRQGESRQSQSYRANASCGLTGLVVAVLKPGSLRERCIATVLPGADMPQTGRVATAYPMDRRLPPVRLSVRDRSTIEGKRLVVAIDGWKADSALPDGHVLASLGPAMNRDTEVRCIMYNNGFETALKPYPYAALRCLPVLPSGVRWTTELEGIRLAEMPAAAEARRPSGLFGLPPIPSCCRKPDVLGRADLRALPCCSIDPPGCKDIDDALSVMRLENGNLSVGVHIADVTHFVKEATPLDDEASSRGTTVYLTDRRLDMLPPMLSTYLCSLRARTDRLAMSTMWELREVGERTGRSLDHADAGDSKGGDSSHDAIPDGPVFEIVPESTWCGLSVIRSTHALTYDQAQRLADCAPPNDPAGYLSDKDRRLTGIKGDAWQDLPIACEEHVGGGKRPDSATAAGFEYLDPVEGGVCGAPVHPSDWEDLRPRMQQLVDVSRWLRAQRVAQGGVSLSGQEVQIDLGDNKPGDTAADPVGLEHDDHCEMHEVVADLMIFANETVARVLFSYRPYSALLRWHLPPTKQGVSDVVQLARAAGLDDDTVAGLSMRRILGMVRSRLHAEKRQDMLDLVSDVAARAMQEAQYGSTGDAVRESKAASTVGTLVKRAASILPKTLKVSSQSALETTSCPARGIEVESMMRHFGLGLDFYTHFTSPIRRYADVVVHRQLRDILFHSESVVEPRRAGYYAVSVISPTTGMLSQAAGAKPTAAVPRSLAMDILGDMSDSSDSDSDSDLEWKHAGSGVTLSQSDVKEPCETTHKSDVPAAASGADANQYPWAIEGSDRRTDEALSRLCVHLNDRTRQAKEASRDCDDLFLAMLVGRAPELHSGTASRIMQRGILVFVPELARRVYVPFVDGDGTVILPRALSYSFQGSEGVLEPSSEYSECFSGAMDRDHALVRVPGATIREAEDCLEILDSTGRECFRLKLLEPVPVLVASDVDKVKARSPRLIAALAGGLDRAAVAAALGSHANPIKGQSAGAGTDGVLRSTGMRAMIPTVREAFQSASSRVDQLAGGHSGSSRSTTSPAPFRSRSRAAFGCYLSKVFKRRPMAGLQYVGAGAAATGTADTGLGGASTSVSAARVSTSQASQIAEDSLRRQAKLKAAKQESKVQKRKRQGR